MDLSEAIFESESLDELEVLVQEIISKRDTFYREACESYKLKSYASTFDRLARMNVIQKKLEHCDTRSEKLKSRKS